MSSRRSASPSRRRIAAYVVAGALAILPIADAAEARDLRSVQADIVDDYPAVLHLDGAALAERARDALLFDVREVDEFAVSHLPGARRVDPDMDADAFMAAYGALIGGRDVVFYCSVGVRSSRMVERLSDRLGAARSVWNLEGGVFAWHNASRPLENAAGATDFVHPYNRSWGRLVERSAQIKTAP